MLNKYVKAFAVAVLAVSASTAAYAHHVTGTITLPNLPEQLAVNPFTNRVYVAVPNFGAEPYDYLTVIDGANNKIVKNIKIDPVAYAVAVDPFNGFIYVGGIDLTTNESEVVIVSQLSDTVVGKVHVSSTPGDGIQGLAVDPLTGNIYVANGSDDEVDIIHGILVTKRISVTGEPFGVAVNPFSNLAYVSLLNGNVAIIDGKIAKVKATTPIGTANQGIAVDILTGNVFTTNSVYTTSSTVGVLGSAGNVIGNIPVGNTPIGIDVDFGTHDVFVANTQDGTLSIINGESDTVFETLAVSGLFLAVNPVTENVYVGSDNSTPTLTVITEK